MDDYQTRAEIADVLAKPFYATCTRCRGKGEMYLLSDMHPVTCDECEGAGVVRTGQPS